MQETTTRSAMHVMHFGKIILFVFYLDLRGTIRIEHFLFSTLQLNSNTFPLILQTRNLFKIPSSGPVFVYTPLSNYDRRLSAARGDIQDGDAKTELTKAAG